jgi:hypothetical protein
MTEKTGQAGWVVEITPPAKAADTAGTLYFDVAIKSAPEAVTAAACKAGLAGASSRVVRPLSSDEIEFSRLKPGEVRPS